MSITGEEGRTGVRVGPSLVDVGTGSWAVIAILASLRRRDITGEGAEIDCSLYETALSWVNTHVAGYLATGKVPGPRGTENASLAPYRMYQAEDGHVMICCRHRQSVPPPGRGVGSRRIGPTIRASDTNPQRVANRAALNEMIAAAIRADTCAHWVDLLDRVGVPCARLQTLDEVASHPQTEALGMLIDTPDGKMRLMGLPISFDGTRPGIARGPAELGADTAMVLPIAARWEGEVASGRRQKPPPPHPRPPRPRGRKAGDSQESDDGRVCRARRQSVGDTMTMVPLEAEDYSEHPRGGARHLQRNIPAPIGARSRTAMPIPKSSCRS